MKRCLEPVDLMVVLGLCATVFGAYFMFMSSNGLLRAGVPPTPAVVSGPVTIMDAMDWVQPALGEAIVQDAIREHRLSQELSDSALRLSQAIIAAMRVEPSSVFERIREQARRTEDTQSARVEYVSGRTIVEGTTRGLRTGALSVHQLDGRYNERLIRTAGSTRARMETAFRDIWQPSLGHAIVQASIDRGRLHERTQQKLGETIRDLTLVQERFRESQEALQGQLAALVIAAVTTEMRAELFNRLAAAEFPRSATLPFSAPVTWPSVPAGLVVAATGLLVMIFLVGMRLTGIRAEPEAMVPGGIVMEPNGERWESIVEVSRERMPDTQGQPDAYRKSA
jgi:hypothetical protein